MKNNNYHHSRDYTIIANYTINTIQILSQGLHPMNNKII